MTDNITPIRPAGPGQVGEGGCPKHGMAGVYGGEFKDGQHRVFCDLCNAEQAAAGAESADLAALVKHASARCKMDGCHHKAYIEAVVELDAVVDALGMSDTDDSLADEIRKIMAALSEREREIARLRGALAKVAEILGSIECTAQSAERWAYETATHALSESASQGTGETG